MVGRHKRNSDKNLVSRILSKGKGRDEAIQYLFDRNIKVVAKYVVEQGGKPQDADDLLYDGLSILFLNLEQNKFSGKSSIHTYLVGICKNVWRDRVRRQNRNEDLIELLGRAATEAADEPIQTSELEILVREVLRKIGEKCAEILLLWAEKIPFKEIAQEVGLTLQSTYNRKKQCFQRIKVLQKENHPLIAALKELHYE